MLGAVTGIVGSITALEAMKLLTMPSAPTPAGRLLLLDGMHLEFRIVKPRPRKMSRRTTGTEYRFCSLEGSVSVPIITLDYKKASELVAEHSRDLVLYSRGKKPGESATTTGKWRE